MTTSDPFTMNGQRVLVTGGTRGIGRAISIRMATAGATVLAGYARNDDAAEALVQEATGAELSIEPVRADLTTPKGIERLAEALGSLERLDTLVHCAASGVHRPIRELTPRQFDFTINANVRSFLTVVQTALPLMRNGGAIVAVSSEGAVRAVPSYGAVGSSKAALESLARHLAVELAPDRIRVNVLSPGTVKTDAWAARPDADSRLAAAAARTPTGHLTTVDEVASAAQFLCSAAAAGVVGHTLVVDGGKRIVE